MRTATRIESHGSTGVTIVLDDGSSLVVDRKTIASMLSRFEGKDLVQTIGYLSVLFPAHVIKEIRKVCIDRALVLFRGLPGAGKSTLASLLCDVVVSADDYFQHGNQYVFEPTKIYSAHADCITRVKRLMIAGTPRIGVANVFSKQEYLESYYRLADLCGYTVFSIIVENRHGGQSIHDVPYQKVEAWRDEFDVSL